MLEVDNRTGIPELTHTSFPLATDAADGLRDNLAEAVTARRRRRQGSGGRGKGMAGLRSNGNDNTRSSFGRSSGDGPEGQSGGRQHRNETQWRAGRLE